MRYIKQHIFSTFSKSGVLLALLAAVLVSGCTTVDDYTPKPRPVENGVQFTLEVPNIGIPKESSSRSMAGSGLTGKEDEVKSVDILVFDNATNKFLEHVKATDIQQDLSTSTVAKFSARMATTESSALLVVVANKDLTSIASGFNLNTTKAQALAQLTHSSTGKWLANGASANGYTAIPMYGETVVAKITSNLTVPKIDMTRMLARIDVVTSASNFTVDEVYLVNYNTAGYIAPQWDGSGQLTNTGDINIPSSDGKQTGAGSRIPYPVNGSKNFVGEIYTFEAPAAVDVPGNDVAPSRRDAACIIIKGRMTGEVGSSYYRVDFLRSGTSDYIALKRNYKYIFDIQQAYDAGYPNIEEAIASYRTMTNLNVRVITYGSLEKIKSVVYDGQYMLGVGEPEVNLWQFENNGYNVDVYTDSPGGWKATITGTDSQWLKFSNGSNTAAGSPDMDTHFSLKIPYYTAPIGEYRDATINITAGRLNHTVTVRQTVKAPGMIRFMDAYGNILDNGLFFPMEDPDTHGNPEAQTVYIMWTSASAEAWRHDRRNYQGDTPMSYVSMNPNIPSVDQGNAVRMDNGVQAVTMQPTKGTEDWRWDVLYFNLFDNDGQQAGHQMFELNQGALTFELFDRPTVGNSHTYQLELGPVQTLELFSNVNWEITKVEEIGATGLLAASNLDLKVGTSNMINTVNTPNVKRTIWGWGVDPSTDIVAGGGHFNLTVPTGAWVSGKEGIVRITFKNLMHTKGHDGVRDDTNLYKKQPEDSGSDDDYYPFFRTIDLIIKAIDGLTYTGSPANSRFQVNPKRYVYENASAYLYYSTAEQNCKDLDPVGNSWRMPTMSEGLLASIWTDNLGGTGLSNPSGWFTTHNGHYWTKTKNAAGDRRIFMVGGNGGTSSQAFADLENYVASVRCVHTQTVSGTKYPYTTPNYSDPANSANKGVLIVSRETNGTGVADPNGTIFFKSTDAVTETTNKIAPKLLVSNENTAIASPETLTKAKSACLTKGNGWRLPTQREAILMMSVGMTDDATLQDTGFGDYSLTGFTKMPLSDNKPVWTVTQSDASNNYILNGYSIGNHGKTSEYWVMARCVKSIF